MEFFAFAAAFFLASLVIGIPISLAVAHRDYKREYSRRNRLIRQPVEIDPNAMDGLVRSMVSLEDELIKADSNDARTRLQRTILLAQIVLGRVFLFETIFVRLQASRYLWRFRFFLVPFRMLAGRVFEMNELRFFHYFFHISRIGSAKAAFTEEPRLRIDPRTEKEAAESIALLSAAGRYLNSGSASSGVSPSPALFKDIVLSYCADMMIESDERITFDRPVDHGEERETVALLELFAPAKFIGGSFCTRFRELVSSSQFEGLSASRCKSRGILLMTHLFKFLSREFDVMPLYRSPALRNAADIQLARYFRKFHRSAVRVFVDQSDEWAVFIQRLSDLIEVFYRYAGRAETLGFLERTKREFFRDYSQCLSGSQIAKLQNSLRPLSPIADTKLGVGSYQPNRVANRGLAKCFLQVDGQWVWDMAQLFRPAPESGLDLDFENVIAWLVAAVDHTAYDRVVGIARSGVIPASIISIVMGKPLSIVELDVSFDRQPLPSSMEGLLIVDDCIQSGFSLSIAALMLGRTAIGTRGLQALTMTICRDIGDQGGSTLPGVKGLDRLFAEATYCSEYRYTVTGATLEPRITGDASLAVDKQSRETIRQWLRERFPVSSVVPAKEQLAKEIRALCTSENFVKLDLLFDFPKTILSVAHYYRMLFIKDNIRVVVGASPNTIPILTAIKLLDYYEDCASRNFVFVFAPRSRTTIPNLDNIGVSEKIAVFDLSLRSGARLRFVEKCLLLSQKSVFKAYVLGKDDSKVDTTCDVDWLFDVGASVN